MLPETGPSKLSGKMLTVLLAFQKKIRVFLTSDVSVVLGFIEDLSEVYKNKHVFKCFAYLVLKCLSL